LRLTKKFGFGEVSSCQTCKHYDRWRGYCILLMVKEKYKKTWKPLRVAGVFCDLFENENDLERVDGGYHFKLNPNTVGNIDPQVLMKLRNEGKL